MVATERTFLHTGTPWTYLAFKRSQKKNYPVQDHEFIGTWHWQRPLTTMVTIRTTSFNTEELYILPLKSAPYFVHYEVGQEFSYIVNASYRLRRVIAECWRASCWPRNLYSGIIRFESRQDYQPYSLKCFVVCLVTFQTMLVKTKKKYKPLTQNTKKFVRHRQSDPFAAVVKTKKHYDEGNSIYIPL